MENANNNKHLDQQDPEELKNSGNDKGKHKYEDPSGTDPEKYENLESDNNERTTNFGKKPKNHTTPDERMINPDRGDNKP